MGCSVCIQVQILVDKDIAGEGRSGGRARLVALVLLNSSAEPQDLGDFKLEFSVWVIVKIYLSK